MTIIIYELECNAGVGGRFRVAAMQKESINSILELTFWKIGRLVGALPQGKRRRARRTWTFKADRLAVGLFYEPGRAADCQGNFVNVPG